MASYVNEMKNAYIWKYIEQTYTMASQSWTVTNMWPTIYKQWYKIKEITVKGSWIVNSSAYNFFWSWISQDASRTQFYRSAFNWLDSGTFWKSKLESKSTSWFTDWHSIPTSWVNDWTTTNYEYTVNVNWGNFIVNWNTLDFTTSSAEKAILQTLFNSQYACIFTGTNSTSAWVTTVKVIYEPN